MGDSGDAVTTMGWHRAGGEMAGSGCEGDDVADLSAAPMPPPVPGYELGALLARGATSEVWAAVALDGGRRVAVKVVHAELDALEVASREAAVSARAASAHVVPVEACVPLPDGRVAVVMPHLLGGAVDALVRARGHLSPGEVVTVLAPVASALGRLHDLGVVHGDVSPGNVLLDLDGRPLLADLGLGHVVGDVSPGVWGTDGYVAPEVLIGADPAPASDVYALGALGWLCLTGTVPGPPGLRPELSDVCLAGEGSDPVVSALAMAISAEPRDRPGAHELAWLLFAAAEPEPLRLVHGDDEVSAVTYRLRAAAGRPPAGSASRRPTWWPPRRRVRAALRDPAVAEGEGQSRWLAPVIGRSPRQPDEGPMAPRSLRSGRHGSGVVQRGWGPVARPLASPVAPVAATAQLAGKAPSAGNAAGKAAAASNAPTGTAAGKAAPMGTAVGKAAPMGTAVGKASPMGTAVGKAAPMGTAVGKAAPMGTAVGQAAVVASAASRPRMPRMARSAVLSALLCLGLLSLVVLGTAVLGRAGDTAQARPGLDAGGVSNPSAASAGSGPTGTAGSTDNGSTSRAAGTDPRTDARAPTSRARELLTVLADARAAAWREATPAQLQAADARGSAMAARDAADVAEVERAGLRYTALHYTVAEVSVVSATTDRAVLRARIDAGPYRVTAATGSTARPAMVGIPVLVDLVRTDVGWRMADLRPAP